MEWLVGGQIQPGCVKEVFVQGWGECRVGCFAAAARYVVAARYRYAGMSSSRPACAEPQLERWGSVVAHPCDRTRRSSHSGCGACVVPASRPCGYSHLAPAPTWFAVSSNTARTPAASSSLIQRHVAMAPAAQRRSGSDSVPCHCTAAAGRTHGVQTCGGCTRQALTCQLTMYTNIWCRVVIWVATFHVRGSNRPARVPRGATIA